MSPQERSAARLRARTLARDRRDAMRRRARRIRRSVAGLALALFVASFLTVYVQLASGHDPALVANARRRATASHATISTGESSSGTSASSSGESSEASSASAVTTSQS